MILLLHTLIEASVGLLLLFYPGAAELIPGFADGQGESYVMLMKMYGLAACFLAGLSLLAYLKKGNKEFVGLILGSLTVFHLGMTVIQAIYNSDSRAMLLHFLLLILLGGRFIRVRKGDWAENAA
ncbi:hypothetical protein [Neolewinella persica]|uniref:hypothetical protein n=1 Tax=Neolewinella persica TaxID=70998 RepID=UPI0003763AAC|nr:hypothetical protein [Neolewinella persica]